MNFSIQGILGKLADSRARLDLLLKNHEILARQTRRTADFVKAYPVVRIDWLTFAQAVRSLEAQMTDALAYEQGLKKKLADWTAENFGAGSATFPKIDLASLGVPTIAGMSLAGISVPLSTGSYLGEGSITDIASGFVTMNQKASAALSRVQAIADAHMDTLMRVREVLKQNNMTEAAKALDGVIAANTADATRIGSDPSVILLALIAAYATWKAYGWWKNRKKGTA